MICFSDFKQTLRNLAVLPLLTILLATACTLSSEDISTDPSVKLRFSADTLFFDTIFSEIPSISKRLRVFNDQNQTISIQSISLADPNSPYRVTVNGIQAQRFEATRILAKDSILIIVEAELNFRDNDLPYVVEDKLLFNTNGNNQEVSIFSWGQDANFLKDSVVACNSTWKAGKPYVIFNNVLIDSLCTLTIEPGTRIFSHVGSTIFVKGRLQVNGTPAQRVLFMNDRFDGNYRDFAGQWGGITFLEGSSGNVMQYVDIRNAEVGIWLGTPDDDSSFDLKLENCIIENMSDAAVLSFTSDLEMTNCLLTNTGQLVFAGLAGGNYMLTHNTIANYGFGFFRTQPVLTITDHLLLADGSTIQGPVHFSLKNNIVWGNSKEEIALNNDGGETFIIDQTNNLLRTSLMVFVGFNNLLNQDPLFIDPENFNYQLDTLSPAIGAGANLGLFNDILGNPRTVPPDMGAYNRQ